jgi:CheY-like chemotaxis protein
MYQILTNLLNNAIKFTEKGTVGLQIMKVEDTEAHVKLEFKIYDTGIGIPQEKLPIIFDLFTQVNMDSAKKFGGTGLGLSITRQLVQLHGGTITVESEVGHGTTFHVVIPFEKVEQIETKPKQELPPAAQHHVGTKNTAVKPVAVEVADVKTEPKHKPHILLAEDNTFNQMLAKTVINKYLPDADLTIANNGVEVMKHLNNGHIYDVILMDVQMPEMDGFETTRTIRQSDIKKYNTIPIIACTAGVTPPEVEECYNSGMDDFLAKPFQPNDLVNKINYYLNNKKTN